MKKGLKNILFLSFCLFLLQGAVAYAYTPDAATQKQADAFTRQIQKKLVSLSPERAEKLQLLIHAKLVKTQNTFIHKTNNTSLQKNAFYELVRRQLFTDSFETQETIFDD